MSTGSDYTETTTVLARNSGTTENLVRRYDGLGLLDSIRLESGVRLFRRGQEELVRQLRADRVARRGIRA